MPRRKMNCYVAMLPVIKAEESLRVYQATACGVGPKSRAQASQMKQQVKEWVRTMQRYSGRPRPAKPKNATDMRAALAAMGIKLKETHG